MSHVVLLGDSVFDNASYVPGQAPVIEQLRRALPGGWQATLLAIDGDVTTGVAEQLDDLPRDATHLVVSVGGNDALQHSFIVHEAAGSVADVLGRLADIQANFRRQYRRMLDTVLARELPAIVCTVYDAIPGLEPPLLAALSLFNDVIAHEAFRAGIPVIDLRLVCTEAADYSPLSPIEPSHAGGLKIARAIAAALATHDFTAGRSCVYC
ncbi:MAG: SGNH/GDSL hydrolase family protein [Pirellulales bacterium]